jgi:hypothetical protein
MIALRRTSFETPCSVEVELSDAFCRANVVLANDYEVGPGDRVRVHGAPISVGFGERRVEQRIATVERASTVERLWTKFAGHFEMAELYEVSFTDRTSV